MHRPKYLSDENISVIQSNAANDGSVVLMQMISIYVASQYTSPKPVKYVFWWY